MNVKLKIITDKLITAILANHTMFTQWLHKTSLVYHALYIILVYHALMTVFIVFQIATNGSNVHMFSFIHNSMSYNVNQRMALPYMAPLVYLFICLNSITVYHVLWALA